MKREPCRVEWKTGNWTACGAILPFLFYLFTKFQQDHQWRPGFVVLTHKVCVKTSAILWNILVICKQTLGFCLLFWGVHLDFFAILNREWGNLSIFYGDKGKKKI